MLESMVSIVFESIQKHKPILCLASVLSTLTVSGHLGVDAYKKDSVQDLDGPLSIPELQASDPGVASGVQPPGSNLKVFLTQRYQYYHKMLMAADVPNKMAGMRTQHLTHLMEMRQRAQQAKGVSERQVFAQAKSHIASDLVVTDVILGVDQAQLIVTCRDPEQAVGKTAVVTLRKQKNVWLIDRDLLDMTASSIAVAHMHSDAWCADVKDLKYSQEKVAGKLFGKPFKLQTASLFNDTFTMRGIDGRVVRVKFGRKPQSFVGRQFVVAGAKEDPTIGAEIVIGEGKGAKRYATASGVGMKISFGHPIGKIMSCYLILRLPHSGNSYLEGYCHVLIK
jgi:hypothetical protein